GVSECDFDPIRAPVSSLNCGPLDEDEVAVAEDGVVRRAGDAKSAGLRGRNEISQRPVTDEVTEKRDADRGDEDEAERLPPQKGTDTHGPAPRPFHVTSGPDIDRCFAADRASAS